jgi:hypothetical protein
MTTLHIVQIAIGSAIFLGAVLALRAHERCGQCLRRIYFWQSRVLYKASGRFGWLHIRCDHALGTRTAGQDNRRRRDFALTPLAGSDLGLRSHPDAGELEPLGLPSS